MPKFHSKIWLQVCNIDLNGYPSALHLIYPYIAKSRSLLHCISKIGWKIPHITSSWRGVVFWKQWHCRFQISLQICTLTEVPRPPLTRRSGDQIVNWILSGTSFRKEKGGQKSCQMVGQRLRHPGCHIWDAATFVSRILPKSRFIKRWAGYVLDKMNIIWFDSNSRWTRWFRHCYQEAFHMFSNWLQLAKKRII